MAGVIKLERGQAGRGWAPCNDWRVSAGDRHTEGLLSCRQGPDMEDRRTGSPSEPSGGQHLAFKLLAPGTVGEGYSVAGHPLVRGHRPQQPWGTNRQTVGQFWFCIQAGTTLQRREQASVGRWGGPVTGVGNQSSGQCVWEEYLNRIRKGKEERGRKRRHKALQRETLGQRPVTAGLGPVSVTTGESHPLLWWMGALRARIPCLAGCGSTEKNAGPVRNSDNIMTRRYVICTFA